jgi:3-hydroxybutyryl-CoA dehydrogenase
MPIDEIKKVCFVGAGTMGCYNSLISVGLNVVADILGESAKKEEAASPEIIAAIDGFLQPYIQSGALGVKTGRGFYEYPDPAYQKADFLG